MLLYMLSTKQVKYNLMYYHKIAKRVRIQAVMPFDCNE